jgi:hypothetical protein
MYVIALLLTIALHPTPETRNGSILAADFSEERIVMAADSRATDNNGHRIDDAECKINVIANSLIFVAGGREHISEHNTGKTLVDATELAVSARRENPKASVEKVAMLWGEKMKASLGEIGKLNREALIGGLEYGQTTIALGIFAGAESDGRLSAYETDIDYAIVQREIILTAHPSPIPHDIQTFFHHGGVQFGEFIEDRTPRASAWRLKLRRELDSKHITDQAPYFLIEGVRAAIEWAHDEAIGGEVDALILHRGGKVEWLYKKKDCYHSPK